MKFRIFGASDDLAEIDGDVRGELGHGEDDNVEVMIGDPGSGCIVTLGYCGVARPKGAAGVWEVAVRQMDEDVPLPGSFTLSAEGYSTVLHVEVPGGTPVLWRTVRGDVAGEWTVPS